MKNKIRPGIRFRMLAGLLLVFLASAGCLFVLLQHRMDAGLSEEIADDMMRIWQDTNLYTRQLLVSGKKNNDVRGFVEVREGLHMMLDREGAFMVWSADGEYLGGNRKDQDYTRPDESEMEKIRNGRAVLKIDFTEGNRTEAAALLPVIVDGKTVGIVRVVKEHTEKRASQEKLLMLVMRWTALVLAAAFLLCFLIMGGVIRPVLQLSALSRRISGMVKENRMEELPTPDRRLTGRKDEIGELAANYSGMIDTIRRQFAESTEDRKRILALMHSKQLFFDHATHELKTPLTTIRGYAQLIREDGGEDKELFETGLSHILSESERLHKMVLELLELSDRKDREERTVLDLSEIAEDVVSAMQLKANRYGNEMICRHEGSCMMTGQPGQLKQLLINLTDNAVKYGDENSRILVEIKESGDKIVLTVTNRGQQIPEDQLEKIFEPFYRIDKNRSREMGSSGLGLSICRKIAADHGGTIKAACGGGETVFTVILAKELPGERREV